MFFFLQIYSVSLTSCWNLEFPSTYLKSVIKTIIIENNESFVKKPTFDKKTSYKKKKQLVG